MAIPTFLVAAAVVACADAPGELPVAVGPVESLPSPAGAPAGEPFLASGPDGRTLLSWLELQADSSVALRFAALEGDTWSEPRTIVTGRDFFVNWADFPSIVVLPDGRLASHWLQREGPGTYAYGVRVALSADGGATWSAPITPHTDGTLTEHGFVSLFPDAGELGAIWLDGRKMAGGDGHGGGEMTIRFARLSADGTRADETELDERTCECCQTDVALTDNGPVVVYRDRSPEEVRDIVISRRVGGAWTPPARVHADDWTIAACPVNGPAVAARGQAVAVAWFTAAADVPQVNVAFSADAGATFGPAIRVDDGNPGGRVDLLMLESGEVLVSWLERTGEGASIRVRRVATDGRTGPAAEVATSSAARASGFPRMVASGPHIVFAWTEPGSPAKVRVARAGS